MGRGFLGSDSVIGRWVWSLVAGIQLVGAGSSMAWYVVAIRGLASDSRKPPIPVDYDLGAVGAIFRMWVPKEDTNIFTLMCLFAMILAAVCAR